MGPYGHGEPPYCRHPERANVGFDAFANPRTTPPDWCPLRGFDGAIIKEAGK